jgi:hypothetical protein
MLGKAFKSKAMGAVQTSLPPCVVLNAVYGSVTKQRINHLKNFGFVDKMAVAARGIDD